MKVSKGTLIRTVVLFVALLNQVLTVSGKNPLPFSSEETEQGVSMLFTMISALTAWWKNNSFTHAALEGDRVMKSIKDSETGC